MLQNKGEKEDVPVLKHRIRKTYGGVWVKFHAFLNLAVDGVEWSDLHCG
jgi:hypothetical protein